jgi:fluoroquinolone transport system permease protein
VRRLTAALAADFRLHFRGGFGYASVVAALILLFVLKRLPDASMRGLLPSLLLANAFFTAFYLIAISVLREKGNGSFAALQVTPLRPHEYLASKAAMAAGLAACENLVIAAACLSGFHPWPLLLGSVAAGLLFSLLGFAAAAFSGAMRKFHAAFPFAVLVLLLPALSFGSFGGAALYLHPLHAPLSLLNAAFQPASARQWAYGLAYSGFGCGAAFMACRRAFASLRES